MNLIREWVRNLTLLIILASFLDLLVPQNSMKRYIKMVMGLVILLGILNPILTLLRQEVTIDVGLLDFRVPSGATLNEILEKGETYRRAAEAQALRAFQLKIEREAEREALGVEGVAAAAATAKIASPEKGQTQGAEILEVQLAIQLCSGPEGSGERRVAMVEPIRIGGTGTGGSSTGPPETGSLDASSPGTSRSGAPDSAVAREVKRVVASYLGISPDKVKVTWTSGQ